MANDKQVTAKEVASKESGVTREMVATAMTVLKELGITRISKKYDTGDVLYEILRAVKIVPAVDDSIIKDEEEWSQFFETCSVFVKDPEVGRAILKEAMESSSFFSVIVSAIAEHKGLVVPLVKYPGIKLFGRKRKGKEGESETKER